MPSYDDSLTMREARRRYFTDSGLGEGGYADRWVRVALGPTAIYFPNTAGRVRAVRLHDLHHVVTGYDTDLVGEGEIGAWELGSGCRRHWAAWLLNYAAASMGIWLAPRRVWRAFRRGRRRENLYVGNFDEALLDESVGGLRSRLGVPPGGEVAAAAEAP